MELQKFSLFNSQNISQLNNLKASCVFQFQWTNGKVYKSFVHILFVHFLFVHILTLPSHIIASPLHDKNFTLTLRTRIIKT